MVSPSRAEGENFVMGEEAINKVRGPQREPMCADDRFWLWVLAIATLGVIGFVGSISAGVIAYQLSTTPEQICAQRADPPEFCRELAKRPK